MGRIAHRPGFGNGRLRAGGLAATAAVLGFVAWYAPTALASGLSGKWLEVRSPHFVVVSNAGRRPAIETAEHFEQIREIFRQALPGRLVESGPPLRVFAIDGERTMKRFLPAYWERKGSVRPAGVFRKIPTGTEVVIRAEMVAEGQYSTVYHEYFHFLVHKTGLKVPVWLNEGLATYWGTTRLSKGTAEVGRPDADRLETARVGQLLPLEELMAVERSSTHYSRDYEAQRFYAQSWALTHYLIVGDSSGKGREQVVDYLRRVNAGESSGDAAVGAFGDLEDLRSRLKAYIRKVSFPYAKMPPPAPVAKEKFELRELSRAEAAALAALYLVEGMRTRDVAGLVAAALEGAPARVETHVAAGLLQAFNSEYEQAEQALARAVALEGADSLAHYGFAVLRFYSDRSPEGLATVKQHLERAIALDPGFAPARARLAEVLRRTDGCSPTGLAHVRAARDLMPSFPVYRLKEAQVLFECSETDGARAIAREVVEEAADAENNNICWNGSLWGLAREVLPACDRAVALAPESFAVLDSRGVARAILGDLEGATADLRAALELSNQDDWSEQSKALRSDWIKALEGGENPLTGDALKQFRDDPEEQGLDWWQ